MRAAVVGLMAFVAAAYAQTATYLGDGNYMDLPAIPGMDFVGFGYDVRYIDDTNQGLRLPLMEFTFSGTKTYRYPLYKTRMYRVPDELFVRTVGTAVAENYQFSSIEEYKQNIAATLGFDYTKSSNDPIPPGNVNTTNGASGVANDFNSSATPSDMNTNSRSEGYGDVMPSKYKNSKSGVFEVGVDFQFRKNMLKDTNQLSVHNTQQHQLYQLMVNKNKIRAHMQADINNLKTKRFSNEPDVFRAFFEKYGTHYVQTAMLGGAIDHASVTSLVSETDFITTTVNVSVLATTNQSSTVTTGNNTEKLLPKDSRCRDDPKTYGWSWNTYKEECVLPANTICYAPMKKEDYQEDFSYTMDNGKHNFVPLQFNDSEREEAYKAFPWRRGPLKGTARTCEANLDGATTCQFSVPSHFYWSNTGNLGRESTLVMDSFTQQNSNLDQGISRLMKWSQPQLIEWDMYIVNVPARDSVADVESANIAFSYEGDQATDQDDKTLYRLRVVGSGSLLRSYATVRNPLGTVQDSQHVTDTRRVIIPRGKWVSFKLVIDWETYVTELWSKPTDSLTEDWTLSSQMEGIKLMFDSSGIDRIDLSTYAAGSSRTMWDSLRFCNAAGGAKYAPVSKQAAIRKSQSNMKQKITGDLDFGFEKQNTNKQIQETSNYKVKGGDSSIVDLLNLRAVQTTFAVWKASIPQNPAPVTFTLREIAALFPKDPEEVPAEAATNNVIGKRQSSSSGAVPTITIIPREQMKLATESFLTTIEVGEIIYPKPADQPSGMEGAGHVVTLTN